MKPNSDYEVISALRAILKGHELQQTEVGGIPVDELKALVEKMKSCKFGIVYWGMGLTQTRGKYMNLVALLKLAQDLNQFTKFSCAAMRGHGNVVGMAQVLTWQTGYPFHVNMSRGYPRFNPGEFSVVDLLVRKEVDAALVIAGDAIGNFPGGTAEHLKTIPLIAIDPKESDTTRVADIVIPAAQGAIGAGGMAYRMDHIPLMFKKVVESPYPSDREILDRIIAKVKVLKHRGNGASAQTGRD
jgi:formylmethanofuran dehydrogenase subunit B